jgi:hypothetical protein
MTETLMQTGQTGIVSSLCWCRAIGSSIGYRALLELMIFGTACFLAPASAYYFDLLTGAASTTKPLRQAIARRFQQQ